MADIDLSKLDKRTVERYLRTGVIDEKTYDKFLKSLPDVTEKGLEVETQMFDDEDLDEGDEDDGGDDEATPE